MSRQHRIPFRDATNRNVSDHRVTCRQSFATPAHRVVCEGSISTTPDSAARPSSAAHKSAALCSSPLVFSPIRPLYSHNTLLRFAEQAPVLTVVLDLDETLVSNRRADLPEAVLRPYAVQVLQAFRKLSGVEVVLWTASTEDTARPVVDQLSQGRDVFDDIIFRNAVWFTEPVHVKDIQLLGRDSNRVVVFDNAPNCCKLNPNNAILVEDFTGVPDDNDATLLNVFRMVQLLRNAIAAGNNVPNVLSRLASENSQSMFKTVEYALPDAWRDGLALRNTSPILIPPHGLFYRLSSREQNSNE